MHDFNYANTKITTKEADEQLYRDSEGTGLFGSLSRAALRTKSALGFDEYFRGNTSVDNTIANCQLQYTNKFYDYYGREEG